jgi:hypothetical protein
MNIPPREMSLPTPEKVSQESLVVNSTRRATGVRRKRRCSLGPGIEDLTRRPGSTVRCLGAVLGAITIAICEDWRSRGAISICPWIVASQRGPSALRASE